MEIDIVPFQARLERLAYNNHIQVVNFANIENKKFNNLEKYIRAMVIGQSFNNELLNKFGENIFNYHINLIKKHLSDVAYKIYHFLTIEGYESLILPPLFLKDDDYYTDINKEVAKLAGIGNIGKNDFFVSPTYGVKIILSSILTTAPLEFDPEYKINLCKNCNICDTNGFNISILSCPYGKDKSKD